MNTTDLSNFPLIITRSSGVLSIEDYRQSLNEWEEWFSKKEPFVLMSVRDAESLHHAPGAAKIGKEWMKANKENFHLVKAMAMVVPETHYSSLSKMDIEKAFGFPGKVFTSEENALEWLKKILNYEK